MICFFDFFAYEEHVAQSVEHLTFNEVVVGSIPTVLTITHAKTNLNFASHIYFI